MTSLPRGLTIAFFSLMVLLCVAIGLYAFAFQAGITGSPDFHARFAKLPLPATMHVLGGGTVLLIGGFQFIGGLRRRYPVIHRNLGRIYLLFVLIGGLGGLGLAPRSDGGLTAHVGFSLLAILWLFSAAQAYLAIRAGNVAAHRAWMLRNFAMTFAAVTLRLYLGAMTVSGISFAEAYPVVAWLAWVPNLILVEWYMALRASRRGGPDCARSPSAGAGMSKLPQQVTRRTA